MNKNKIFEDLFVLEIANNHWGSVERGKKIIHDYSRVISNKDFGFYEIIVENENNECMIEKIEITSKLNDSIFIDIENKYPNAKVHREKIKIGYFINFDKYFS